MPKHRKRLLQQITSATSAIAGRWTHDASGRPTFLPGRNEMGKEDQSKSWKDLFVGLRMREVMRSEFRDISGAQLKIYLLIRAQMDWTLWETECSLRNLADMSGSSIRIVKIHVKNLIEKGLLERTFTGQGHRMCQYRVRELGGEQIFSSEETIYSSRRGRKVGDLTTEGTVVEDKQEAPGGANAPSLAASAAKKQAPAPSGAGQISFTGSAPVNAAKVLSAMVSKGVIAGSARALVEQYGVHRCWEALKYEHSYGRSHSAPKLICAFLKNAWNTPAAAAAGTLREVKGVDPVERRKLLNAQIKAMEDAQK